MTGAEELVRLGLVQSLARPGGNIRGLTIVPGAEIYGKDLEFLTEILPKGARIGVLFNTTVPVNALWLHATEEAVRGLGVTLVPVGVRSAKAFEHALAVMQHENATGFVVLGEPLFTSPGNPERINDLAVRSGLAAMWPIRSGAEAGGLMSYSPTVLDR
jgi:putative ABC transport system substrate-binding protein